MKSAPLTQDLPVSAVSESISAKPVRLASLDIFRGMTIAGMLLVNNPGHGGVYSPLEHSAWNGWTPTDLVFPFFIFIMGVAIPFSFAKRSLNSSRREQFFHVIARSLSLFLLGEFGYAIPYFPYPAPAGHELVRYIFAYAFLLIGFVVLLYPWKSKRISILVPIITAISFVGVLLGLHFYNQHMVNAGLVTPGFDFGGGLLTPWHLRTPGVLQRIGLCYAAAGSLTLWVCFRNAEIRFAGWKTIAATALVLIVGYAMVMRTVSHPSLVRPGQTVTGNLDREDNLARYVDEKLLGTNEHPAGWGVHSYTSYPDPEGILSTFPAIATALLGVLAGLWLRTRRPAAERCAGMLAFGVLACVLAGFLESWLMPVNKQIWSSSYVVLCAGFGLLGLGAYFYLNDVLCIRKIFLPFTWYGMNAITAFVLAGIFARAGGMIRWTDAADPDRVISLHGFLADHAAALGRQIPFGDPHKNGSLVYSIGFIIVIGLIMWVLYRMRVFLKV